MTASAALKKGQGFGLKGRQMKTLNSCDCFQRAFSAQLESLGGLLRCPAMESEVSFPGFEGGSSWCHNGFPAGFQRAAQEP